MPEEIEKTIEQLKNHRASFIGFSECKKSAVTIPLIQTEGGYEVLFEVRSGRVESQPGDICLPGGMLEPGEEPEDAAVRETMEELCIKREQICVLGLMDIHWGRTDLAIYPYAALLSDYQGSFSADEVAEVFSVPLTFFLDAEPEEYWTNMKVQPEEGFPYERIQGGRAYGWRTRREKILFYQYEGRTIWGLTARIIRSFSEILNKISGEIHGEKLRRAEEELQKKEDFLREKEKLLQEKEKLLQEKDRFLREKEEISRENEELPQDKEKVSRKNKEFLQEKNEVSREDEEFLHEKNEVSPEGEEPAYEEVSPWLIRFLDADSLNEKYEVLTDMRAEIDDKLIDDIAVCLDVVIPKGKLADRYSELKNCIRTRQKYEGSLPR